MYANSLTKEAKLGEIDNWKDMSCEWKLEWGRKWFEWKKPHINNLMQELGGCRLDKDNEDDYV